MGQMRVLARESLTWVSVGVLTVKSARTLIAARAKKRVVVKRVEYIVGIISVVKDQGKERLGRVLLLESTIYARRGMEN